MWWNDCFSKTFRQLLPWLTVTSTLDLEELLQHFHVQDRLGGLLLCISRLNCYKVARVQWPWYHPLRQFEINVHQTRVQLVLGIVRDNSN